MHAEIRKATGRKREINATTCIEVKDRSIIMDQADILTRWYEYISELYDDDNKGDILQI